MRWRTPASGHRHSPAADAGVYVGASSVDYGARFFADPSAADVHMMTGNTLSIIANRLSYNLDLRGPSLTVDTACSSSLVALNLAAEAIRNGDRRHGDRRRRQPAAVALLLRRLLAGLDAVADRAAAGRSTPRPTAMCAPKAPSCWCCVRWPRRARRATASIATIVGSGVGQDGRTTGLSLPSAESQRRLLEQVYGDFGVDPSDLAFVEAHGTGTKVGDPIEADALGKGLAQRRAQPLPIGSVKSNIGHLEPASGLAGVLKSILALNHGLLPATLHQVTPNPNIPFDELNLRVVDRNWSLPERRGPALAGVNSFGFGGTNAHVVLRGEDRTIAIAHPRRRGAPAAAAAVGACSRTAAGAGAAAMPRRGHRTSGWSATSSRQRRICAMPCPIAPWCAAPTAAALRQTARAVRRRRGSSAGVLSGQALGHDLPVAFVFSGNGAQWAGMGRAAWHANARFREALQEIDGHFLKRQKHVAGRPDVRRRPGAAGCGGRPTRSPCCWPCRWPPCAAWRRWGWSPQATLGHSVGEIAAAWCAGALSLEQAIDVVIARSRHQESGARQRRHGGADAGRARGAAVPEGGGAAGRRRGGHQQLAQRHGLGAGRAGRSSAGAGVGASASARGGSTSTIPSTARWSIRCAAPLLRELQGAEDRCTARKRFVSSVTGAAGRGRDAGAGALVAQRARAGAVRGGAQLPARAGHAGLRRDRPQAYPERAICATRCARPSCAAPSSRRSPRRAKMTTATPSSVRWRA